MWPWNIIRKGTLLTKTKAKIARTKPCYDLRSLEAFSTQALRLRLCGLRLEVKL